MLIGCCWKDVEGVLRSSMMKAVSYIILFIILSCGIAQSAQADVDAGLAWLSDQSQNDGSFSLENDVATSAQSTSETLRAFSISNFEPTSAAEGYAFLSDATFHSTEYLSRKIIALVESGGNASALLSELEGLQQVNGGFPELPEYDATVLDTALAAEAFSVAGRTTSYQAKIALNYLINQQNQDGGWGQSVLGANSESSVYVTSLVLTAIAPYRSIYNIESNISSAQSYLLGQRDGDNLWGETFVSAQALIALINSLSELDQVADSLSALRDSQLSNGSWDGGVYTTALALRALKLADSPPNAPALANIFGMVVDADTQLPLEGVSITLSGTESRTIATGTDGSFALINLSSGNYSLAISLSGYATVSTSTSLSAGQKLDFGTIQMVKQAQITTGTVKGTVTDTSTGSGLAGATVTVSGVPGSVSTDSNGNFQIADVPPGNVNIQAAKSGYSTATGSVNVVAGGIYIFSPALTPVAQPVTELRGTITDGSSGQPLANVSVSVTGSTTATATTDTQGFYQITGLNPGSISISVSATGYDSVVASTTVYENNIIEFSPKLYPTDTTPPGENTTGVKGVVVDSSTSQPLGSVSITATFGSQVQTFTTDSDGRFEFIGMDDTQGVLQFSLDGYHASTVGLNLTPLTIQDIGQIGLVQDEVADVLPDLVVELIDTSNATTNMDTLEFTGSVSALITNQGAVSAPQAVSVLAFYDNNKNGAYDADVDISLGSATTQTELDAGASATVEIPVSGLLPYRDARITVWVDSAQSVIEVNENNNVSSNSSLCVIPVPDIGSFEPVLKWHWSSSDVEPLSTNVMMAPAIAQTNDDNQDGSIDEKDTPDVIFVSYAGRNGDYGHGILRIISGSDGAELAAVANEDFYITSYGSVAVADIDLDGLIEIVAPKFGGGIVAFEHDGTPKWSLSLPIGWNIGSPSIADLDQDGIPEIILANQIVNNDGTLHATGEGGYTVGGSHPNGSLSVVADIDNTGSSEIIVGASVYDHDGQLIWTNQSVGDGATAVGNFNSDPFAEIVVVGNGKVHLLDYMGNIIWGPVAIPGGGRGGAPTIADVDADGEPEIGVAGSAAYTVFETDGSVKWSMPITDQSSNATGSAVFDFDGDGTAEIAYADEWYFRVYKGSTGEVVFEIPNTSGTAFELPVIADIDNDDHADLIVVSNYYYGVTQTSTTGIRVFEDKNNSWMNTRRIWNQHSYHITNINDDGTVPVKEQPSWLTHNSYRLNAFLNRDPHASYDLTSARLSFYTNGDGSNQLTALVGNAGTAAIPTGTQVSFYEGDPKAGGTLLGSVELPSLPGDSSQTVTLGDVQLVGGLPLYVMADSANLIAECDEDNNVAWLAAPDLLADLIVDSVDTTSTQFDEHTLELGGSVSATIKNQGNANTSDGFELYAFFDANENHIYDDGVDQLLGQYEYPSALNNSGSADITIDVSGTLPFRDAPVTVWVDSGQKIVEVYEDNNTGLSNGTCILHPEIGALQPTVKWEWHSSSSTAGLTGNRVYGPAMVGQLTDDNGDGLINSEDIPDVVFMSMSSTKVLNAVSGTNGQEIWSVAGDFASYGSVALGDIDADGIVEIVVSNADRTQLLAYEHTGELKWSASHGPKFTGHASNTRDGIALADLNGDGIPEIVTGRRAYNNQGVLLWEGAGDYGGTLSYGVNSLIADVDLDGSPNIVAGRTLYDANGNTIWHASANSDGFNAIGNFDEDDFAEIVLVASGKVYLLEHTGSIKWGPVAIPGGGVGGAPTVADMDGDGLPEIGVAGARRYMVLEHDGSIKWIKLTQDTSSHRTGSSVFDFEGDGKAEVVYADEQYIFIYDGTTGSILEQIPNASGTTLEYPVIADIDNDGHAELLAGVSDGAAASYGLIAYESVDDNWVATRNIWNQHTYHITNINDDGTIPAVEEPSWLKHNTYRLNTFPDREPRGIADLTASRLQIIDNGAGQPVSLKVLIGNAGLAPSPANVKVAFYDGDPMAGGTLLGTTTMAQLGVYGYIDVQLDNVTLPADTTQIYAFVDSDEQLSECNETNNITSTTVPLSTLGEITVATDATIYGPNQDVDLRSVITNTGALSGEFIAELRVEDLQGIALASFSNIDTGTLASGANSNHNEGWNTATYIAGAYVLHGILRTPTGEVIAEDKAFFNIQHPDTAGVTITLRTSTDKPIYHTTDTVQIEDLVQNITINDPVIGATLKLQVYDPNDTLVYEQQHPLNELLPQAQRTLMDTMPLSGALEGNYQITAVILDSTAEILASDTAVFEVQEALSASLTGNVTVQSPELYQGDTQVCTDEVTNIGTKEISALHIRQLTVNVETLEELSLTELSRDIASGAATTAVRSLDTTGYEPGNHACILQAEIDGEWQILDYKVFQVLEPPINIDSTFETGTHGRLLVLLDADNCGCWKLPPFGGHLLCESGLHHQGCDNHGQPGCFGQIGDWFDQKDPKSPQHCTQLCSSCNGKAGEWPDIWVQGNVLAKELSVPKFTFGQQPELHGGFSDFKLTSCTSKHTHHAGHGQQCENDPYGPNTAPDLNAQRAYLETLLQTAGWSYTIVTDAESFTRELRSGGYQIYALFNERVKLPEQIQQELREAVNRGEGLLVAGNHDMRNLHQNQVLGIQWRGSRNEAQEVVFAESPLELTGEENLAYADQVARIEGNNVDIIATFNSNEPQHPGGNGFNWPWPTPIPDGGTCGCGGKHSNSHQNSCNDKPEIAVTAHTYGQGKAIYAAFDLLAQATAAGDTSQFADLILGSLQHIHPQNITAVAAGVLPVTLKLNNQGMATPGRVVITLPTGSAVVDPGVAIEEDHTLIWTFDLAEAQELTLNFWLRLPDTAVPVTIDAQIQTGVEPDFQDYAAQNLTIMPQQHSDLAQLLTQLEELRRNPHYWPVRISLQQAQQHLEAQQYCKALKYLVMATDKLNRINHDQAEEIRLQVDWIIWDTSRKLWAAILQAQAQASQNHKQK